MVSGQQKAQEVDVLLVGAGFGSFSVLNRLRKQGLSCTIFEKGSDSGGIWYWNKYPGARVDSDTPIYQLFDEDLWQGFTFSERYAGWKELSKYFKYVVDKWDLNKHIQYSKCVEHAHFDEQRRQWFVECTDGTTAYCKYFLPCIGFAAKKYVPAIPGKGEFEGEIYHTAMWPQWDVKLKDRRIAVIGTGASGIQTIQESAPVAKYLDMYQRTPNFCLPMNQHFLDAKTEDRRKADGEYKKAFEATPTTFAGFTYTFADKNTFDDSEEERKKFWDNLWYDKGGFAFWLAGYKDLFFDEKANDAAYQYWRARVLERIKDPKKAEKLAPENAPHPWGTKRPSLEQNFYEVVSADNVGIFDLNETPIEKITPTGIQTKEGHKEYDLIVFATGFDAVTGSLSQLDIRGTDDRSIKEHWAEGLKTAIGVGMTKFPNMLFLYGPQAPTAFSNGPTCVQMQAIFVDKFIAELEKQKITRFEPTDELELDWQKQNRDVWNSSLFPKAKSWYQGANIPGRRVEPLNWAGGMPAYIEALDKSMENNLQGWKTAT